MIILNTLQELNQLDYFISNSKKLDELEEKINEASEELDKMPIHIKNQIYKNFSTRYALLFNKKKAEFYLKKIK